MKLGRKEIMQYLPHRDPFLFIDSVEKEDIDEKDLAASPSELDSKKLIGRIVTGHFHVNKDLPLFKGHFPGDPILPGVIQIEIMAQTASFCSCYFLKDPGQFAIKINLAGVSHAKFRKAVRPGMDLVTKSKLIQARRNRWFSFDLLSFL